MADIEKAWHRRPRSPDLRWHKDYNEGFCTDGRVLVIDYVKQQASKRGMRKVVAQEIESWEGLQKFYANPSRRDEALLRVFHVQNAPWATRFFLRKFNINDRHPLVGTDFGRYLKRNHFEQRGGKPYLKGKAWKTQHDPWRSISRTMFGLDYMKAYRRHDEDDHRPTFNVQKMMQLNSFDEEDSSMFGWDVYSQRLSCYIQFKEDESRIPAGIKNPYSELPRDAGKGRKPLPHAEDLDNGNTIIIFENSHTGSIEDTLIAARQEWESRWRRLPFYLAFESHDVSSDARLALECMKIILEDVFKSIVNGWEVLLDVCYTHVGILEDRIYEEPADETRAPELWTNSSNWLKVEKIIYVHMDILNELRNNLRDITDEDEDQNTWLVGIPSDFERLKNLIEEDLIKPTANMADLMYKSVGIRDSRHSLRLGVSMWRLSWITFIFLPLNFIVAFFGMNVDTFENDPSLKWFFIVAVPFMCFVLVLWFFTKHMLEQTRQTPYQRGIWDKLFNDLAQQYPKLWSRNGPRDYIRPTGLLARIKWNLILLWSDPSRTGRETSNSDDLGVWSNFKRRLIKRWTGQLRVRASPEDDMFELEEGPDDDGISPLASGMESASEILAAPASSYLAAAAYKASPPLRPDSAPTSTLQIPQTDPYVFLDRTISQPGRMRPPRDSSRESHGSHGQSSGYLVEEEDPNWLKDLKAKTDEVRGWPWGATNLELFRRSLDRQGGEERGAEGSRGGSSGKERQDEKNREKDLENQK
ncbi:MAG: hypothetical protein M1834_001492 [Cirrosporium novae-zelandiae]|nr:MAG: hypothetical protein M1834_008602 [Cirrosporium novae-zelandiae]KAI9736026.1 MAG: hypothetical protein M1834_001492 [Cirrosporium novae-zelandiae]